MQYPAKDAVEKRRVVRMHFSFCKGSRASHAVAVMRLVAVSTIFYFQPGIIIPSDQ